jgi:hypothetical protein
VSGGRLEALRIAALLLCGAAGAAGCSQGEILGSGASGGSPGGQGGRPGGTSGGGTAAGGSGAGGAGPGQPAGPTASAGRVPRRLSADQIRAAFVELTGFPYQGPAEVQDPDSPQGIRNRTDADLLDVFALALGRPDYDYVVKANLEPGISFAKMVEDAARSTCGRAARQEVGARQPPGGKPRLLLKARPEDELPEGEAAIRANIAALVARFWGEVVAPSSEEVTRLLELFRAASTTPSWTDGDKKSRPAGSAVDGWRVVCIALATSPEFYVY